MWATIMQGNSSLIQQRNRYIHLGEPTTEASATQSIECAEALLEQVVYPLASRLGLTPRETGPGSIAARGVSPAIRGELLRLLANTYSRRRRSEPL